MADRDCIQVCDSTGVRCSRPATHGSYCTQHHQMRIKNQREMNKKKGIVGRTRVVQK